MVGPLLLEGQQVRACKLQGDWACVADEAAELHRAAPGDRDAVMLLHEVLQEHRFDYEGAFALDRDWLAAHPDDRGIQENWTETHLTTGRFDEALRRLRGDLQQRDRPALRVLEVIALAGAGKSAEAVERVNALSQLLQSQPEDFEVRWTFGGIRHFAGTNPRFARDRARLLALLDAVEQKDRLAVTRAMEPVLRLVAPK